MVPNTSVDTKSHRTEHAGVNDLKFALRWLLRSACTSFFYACSTYTRRACSLSFQNMYLSSIKKQALALSILVESVSFPQHCFPPEVPSLAIRHVRSWCCPNFESGLFLLDLCLCDADCLLLWEVAVAFGIGAV